MLRLTSCVALHITLLPETPHLVSIDCSLLSTFPHCIWGVMLPLYVTLHDKCSWSGAIGLTQSVGPTILLRSLSDLQTKFESKLETNWTDLDMYSNWKVFWKFKLQFILHVPIIFLAKCMCGVYVGGLRLYRALLRCVLQETAPRPVFGFPALPVLQCGILLFFLGLGFFSFPLLLTSELGLHLHSLYLWVDLWPSEVENLLLMWTSPWQLTRGCMVKDRG